MEIYAGYTDYKAFFKYSMSEFYNFVSYKMLASFT